MPSSPRVNPRAEHAFADYVALGASRSLSALVAIYQSRTDPVPTKHIQTLKEWSRRYGWQARIAKAVSTEADAKLEEAAHLDADTFLATSRLLSQRVHLSTPLHTDVVIKMRESVRKPMPKGGAALNVTVSVEIRHLAEQMAKSLGMEADDLIREAEEIAAAKWDTAS